MLAPSDIKLHNSSLGSGVASDYGWWIGLREHERQNGGGFVWANGMALNWTAWGYDEPGTSGYVDCAYMGTSRSLKHILWRTSMCSSSNRKGYNFICELPYY